MKKKFKSIFLFFIVVIFFGASVFIPEYYIKLRDYKYFNKIVSINQNSSNYKISYDIPLENKLTIIRDNKNKDLVPLIQILEVDILKKNDEELLSRLQEEVGKLIELNVIPDISLYDYKENLIDAELYSMSSIENANEAVSMWVINFGDNTNYDFTFSIDAEDYKIYNIKIYCKEINEIINKYVNTAANDFLAKFLDGYINYMEAYNIENAYLEISEGMAKVAENIEDEYGTKGGDAYLIYDNSKIPVNISFFKNELNKQEIWGFVLDIDGY